MAPTDEVQRTRIAEFGGLHDNSAPTAMPANGAQVMSGCHPQPGGGLRAFYRPTPWRTSKGLDDSSGPYRLVAVAEGPSNSFYDPSYFLITADVDTTNFASRGKYPRTVKGGVTRAYKLTSLSNSQFISVTATGLDGTTWAGDPDKILLTETVPLAALSDPGASSPERYICLTGGTVNASADDIYKLESGATMTRYPTITGTPEPTGIVSHQSRLVAAYGSSIIWTTPGVYDIPSISDPTKFINFGEGRVRWMVAVPPSDLYVGTETGGIYLVQGDLDDPIVRTLSTPASSEQPLTHALFTRLGPVTQLNEGPVMVSGDGGIQPLAPTLQSMHWGVLFESNVAAGQETRFGIGYRPIGGHFAHTGHFLFVRSDGLYLNRTYVADTQLGDDDAADIEAWADANILHLNGALTLDQSTGAWFRSTHPDVASIFAPQNPCNVAGYVFLVPNEEFWPAEIKPIIYTQEAQGPRQHTYEWKSAPLHTKTGRRVHLQEVQVAAYGHEAQPYHENTFTHSEFFNALDPIPTNYPDVQDVDAGGRMEVTATNEHGDTKTVTVDIPGGAHVIAVPMDIQGTTVDVTVKSISNHFDLEAPTLEYIDFGWTEGTVIRPKYAPGGYAGAYEQGY